ncbi:hypothetical protein ACHAWF_009239 [Thalassiosira exigua]
MFKTSTRAARHLPDRTGFFSRCRRSRIFLFAIATIICHFWFYQPISHLVGKKFHIVVLTKSRPNSLLRLLKSIQASNYGNDVVSVNIRIDGTDSKTHYTGESFEWPLKTVTGTQSGGLRAAWLGALTNPTGNAIILEDDVELSPVWYSWLTKAWKAYGDRDDLAGISLQRQNLIPQKPFKKTSSETEIVNDHQPFLYKLVGSIGFSPHPKRWREFLEWVATKDLGTFDAHVEGLVTSDWYKNDKESIWTQLFIRFCEERGLYTLYINLPEGKTLAAHWREKGEHFVEGRGRDFGLATIVKHEFPKTLVKYEWDGVVSGRRTRAHFCSKRHSPFVIDMLRNEFGFREVDANKGEEFDIIYGGYPHCGSKPFDWDMKTGLNARLDFSKLRPSQVWFPCMGCRASVCNKRELCRIQHELDPTACFLWPEHRDDLEHAMRTAPKGTMWVQNRDGSTLNLHAGASVRYIESVEGLTAKHDGTYLVQPYVEPYLGRSRRKSEFRTYIAVTSTNPFRAYIHSKPWVILAGRQYDSSILSDLCIHDTHAHSKKPCDRSISVDDRQLSFTDYAAKEGLNATYQVALLRRVNDLLVSIIQSGWPPAHPVNEGIRQSGASCFSYLRADIGFGPDLQPFVYEINEFPYTNEEATAIRPIVRESHRDLFRMIGLDRPPLPVAEQETWEAAHMGGWRRLHTTPTLLWDGNQAPSPATATKRRFNNNKVLQHAARIQSHHGIVLLQFLNEGFVEMTKSWICNVRRFDVVLPKILFITSDQAAYNALTAFDVTLNVVLEPYSAPKSMTYGQTEYYRYMLFRTKLISTLLDSNHALWLVESDAVWLEDPTDLVLGTPGDLVTMSDKPPQKLLQGGFLLLRPTGVTKRLWTRMREEFESKMKAVTQKDIGNGGSEQLMLDKMIRDDSGLRVEWLDPHKFVPGKWYDDASFRKTVPAPFVVLNNWIKGTDNKIKRAKKWNHWFLDEQGSCFDPRT